MLKYDIRNNETPEACAACGGRCCKRMGCPWSVKDFEREYGEITYENVEKALKAGLIAIDWWEGDYRDDYEGDQEDTEERDWVDRCYYIRMRHVGEPEVCGSWGGRCVALTDRGCKFDWDHRPLGGKSLVGSMRGWQTKNGCKGINPKIEFVADWFRYNEVLERFAYDPRFTESLMSSLWPVIDEYDQEKLKERMESDVEEEI